MAFSIKPKRLSKRLATRSLIIFLLFKIDLYIHYRYAFIKKNKLLLFLSKRKMVFRKSNVLFNWDGGALYDICINIINAFYNSREILRYL